MLFFLLPFLFNPFNLISRWLPVIYLASWPIIVQTLGQETLIAHTVLLIAFILTCDITKKLMLNLVKYMPPMNQHVNRHLQYAHN